jgi:hypothetical protein
MRSRFALVLGLLLALVLAGQASAQTYTQLQVLLPGEAAAPGTGTGKTGVPVAQTVGVPFFVQIRACDSQWNTVTSNTNSILLGSSDASATLPGSFALVQGEASVSVTINAAGSFTVNADDQSDGTIPLATSAPFTSQEVAGFEFSKINQKNQYAGVAMATTVNAVDPNGSTVTGFSGAVDLAEITSYGPGRIVPSQVTLSNGTWSGNVTMYRADETSINRGNVNIEATLPGAPSVNGISDPFTVHPGSFARVQVVVPGQTPLPGSVSGVSGTPASQGAGQSFVADVYATDDYWNPVPGADNVRVTSSDPGFTPVSGALSNGYRQFTVQLATVGTRTLSVTDQTNGSIQGMTSAGIQVTPSAPDHFVIEPFSTPVVAGDSVDVTIRAVDVSDNTIPDYSGNAILSANTGPGSISPEAIVFSAGTWTGKMVFRGAGGSVAFTCSDFASPPHTGTSASFTVNPGPFVGLQVLAAGQTPQGGTASGFSGTPSPQNAGTPFNLRVRAVDAYWNRVQGINDQVSLVSTDAFAGMPAQVTLVNGEVVLPITMYKAGTQTVSASDLDTGGIQPHTSSGIPVSAGAYSRILLIAPGEQIAPGTAEGRTGTATDQSINFAFTVRVYAADQWFNPVSGITDVVRITSGDPLAELPADTALTDGAAALNVRLSTGGFQQITASNVTQPGMPVSTTQVRAISSGFHLEAEVTPAAVQAGEAFTLTVKVTNDAGSVIQEINSSVTVEVQNASTQAPGQGTLLNTEFQLLQGQRSVQETYTFAESIVLVVRDDAGNTPAVTEVIAVSPGAPDQLLLTSNPPWVRGNKHATLDAQVVDAWNNGVPGEPVAFQMVSGAGILTPIDSATNGQGRAAADFLSPRQPEIALIRATSGFLTAELNLETALVDPSAAAGSITSYPNPFHPGEAPTTVAYKLAADARVTMKIYSLSGAEVFEHEVGQGDVGGREGLNEFQWDGRNGRGDVVASGGYVLILQADRNGETIHTLRRRIAVVR